jgi:glycosyltransferase involved in cell wall biosynthesis
LSNLSLAKGIDDVIATFERLARSGKNVRLLLAGPCLASAEQTLIDKALAQWPDRIEYRGPVYGREKSRFYADIDVFVFPTRTESWGIVLTEALSVGRPVIARSRGCVPWIVQGGCGQVIEADADFPASAAAHITRWLENPAEFAAARTAATQRSRELEQDATAQLPTFVDRVRSGRQD